MLNLNNIQHAFQFVKVIGTKNRDMFDIENYHVDIAVDIPKYCNEKIDVE